MGKKIPSDYLKVFSDGTIECQAIDEQGANTLKKTQISPIELAAVISVLNNPQLSDLTRSYALNRFVVDSWMEWDITIDRPSLHPQKITLAFAGGSSEFKLPDALRKLGCQILDLRREVDGDEGAYFNPACTGF